MSYVINRHGKSVSGSSRQQCIAACRCEESQVQRVFVLAMMLLFLCSAQAVAQQVHRDADVWGSKAHQSTHAQVKAEEIAAGIRPNRNISEKERLELARYKQQLLSEESTLPGASNPSSDGSQPN